MRMRPFIFAAALAALGAQGPPDREIERLRREVEAKRGELREAEARLDRALLQQTKSASRPADLDAGLPPLAESGRSPFDLEVRPPSKPPAPPSRSLPGPTPEAEPRSPFDLGSPPSPQAVAGDNRRLEEVEGRLNQLLEAMEAMRKEIEDLRREIRR